jgi:multiple sugar transport system permease protein
MIIKADTLRKKSLTNVQFAWLLIAPSMCILAVVIFYPLVRTFMTSFQKFDLTSPTDIYKYVGRKNYSSIILSGEFVRQLFITLKYSLSAVAGQFILGMFFAVLLNQKIIGRPFFRAIFLLPWVIPTVVCALLWTWVLNVQYGVFNFVLRRLGIISQFRQWLGDPKLALFTVAGVTIWKWFPFDFVMLLAGLQTVPAELLDAAAVDGAGSVRKFIHVTVPCIRNIIVVVLMLTLIWSFQEFTMIWGTTKGGPMNLTSTLTIHIYRTAFDYFRMGQASASGVLWMIILLVVSIISVRTGFRELA